MFVSSGLEVDAGSDIESTQEAESEGLEEETEEESEEHESERIEDRKDKKLSEEAGLEVRMGRPQHPDAPPYELAGGLPTFS